MNQFLFGVYPYIALAVFLVGSLIRFERDQYTWKSDSSQLLRRGQLRWGSNLFHLGILGILGGHFFGLLTPLAVWHALGMTLAQKQMVAIVAGGIAGVACAAGLVLLIHRRLSIARVRATSRSMDFLIVFLLLAQVLLGLGSIFVSLEHRDGSEMLKFVSWAQAIFTLEPDASRHIAGVAWIYKTHIVLGLTIFLVFPFSRLVHIWSGFGTVGYLTRAYQIVRPR
jgi:nitrate reductase gamma subunit